MKIGIDLGGTKLEIIALDDTGTQRLRERIPTPAHDYEATIAAIVGLVDAARPRVGTVDRIGFGIPGIESPATGLVKNANSTWLIGKPLHADLERALGCSVRLENDANCFAVSEAHDGAGAGRHVVFGVILGTGVGGGIVIDGKPLAGRNAIAGEWGHNPMPWPRDGEYPGPDCYCGLSGCIETFLSGPGMTRDFTSTGAGPRPPKEIVRLAEDGDAPAIAALERYRDRLARALASVVNLIDPDVVVLGGGMSNLPELIETVPRLWERWIFSDRVDTELRLNVHGDSSGVRGAAWLWND